MMKFFRKHMKKLLMIFMSLLLVAWLGGTALTALLSPNPRSAVEATSRYGEISTGDRARADGVAGILGRLGLPWNQPARFFGVERAEPLTLYDWVLVTREAEQAGFVVSEEEAKEFLFNTQRRTLNDVYYVARGLDIAPEEIYAAVGEFLSVYKAIIAVSAAAQVSEAEVRLAARNVYEKLKVHLVVLKAEAFVDPDAALADAELEELFSKYREQERGKGMTFGYFLPPRVKAQYLKLDLEKVTAGLRRSEQAFEREARRYWKENREKDPAFKRPLPEEKADSPDATSQPAEPRLGRPRRNQMRRLSRSPMGMPRRRRTRMPIHRTPPASRPSRDRMSRLRRNRTRMLSRSRMRMPRRHRTRMPIHRTPPASRPSRPPPI